MKSPLRLFIVVAAGMMCLCTCSTASTSPLSRKLSFAIAEITTEYTDSAKTPAPPSSESIVIPGPLRSFLRMAGISQKVLPEDVLPLLARNVYLRGYVDGKESEFLLLLNRYVEQARELQKLAGENGTIVIKNCSDASSLLTILGYQFRQSCGQKNAFLATANPERAFLTIDSGFPLTGLEESLQKGTSFSYAYPSTRVPVLFKESDWIAISYWKKHGRENVLDILLHDPEVCRLYSALARNDAETRSALLQSPGLRRLLPLAPVLDFYGSQLCIRNGHVIVPGGPNAEPGWKELVGASPDSPGDFTTHLLAKDNGWLAVYFDELSRVSREQQKHLSEPPRLKHLYEAFRSSGTEPAATKGVFQKGSDLLVLFTSITWQPSGEPYVPGNLEIWKEILNQKTSFKVVHEWGKHARDWNRPDQLLEAMVAFSRTETDNGPLQLYLMLSEIDNARLPQNRLSDGTVRLLSNKFSRFDSWYLIFSEFPELNDTSITRFMAVADAIDGISNQTLRVNTLGAFQANIGLWQILVRQGEIPTAQVNAAWQNAVEPFTKISSSPQLFDAARSSLKGLMQASDGKENLSQNDVINLLAGPPQASEDGRRMHQELAAKISSVLDDQRLVSLDTLFALNDGLEQMAQGNHIGDSLLPLAGQLREFEMPRPIFTNSEKVAWAPPVYSSRHAELQIRTDLTKVLKGSASSSQLENARGQLAPFLRDTLVGLNYAYYEPPGAQVLHNNPLFVRSHDFSGMSVQGTGEPAWSVPEIYGIGATAGGGAYLIGSLIDLPYTLAIMEEDFIVPENVQALIWRETVPNLLVSATLPRWWNISPDELHAVALYQRFGEELLIASAGNADLQSRVVSILSDRLTPQRLEWVEQGLKQPNSLNTVLPYMLPAETFYLANEYRKKFPTESSSWGPAGQQLDQLCSSDPAAANIQRLSHDFGVPHPILARTYAPDLLNMKPFPASGGYTNRLLGESWESNNLYWARLADEMGYSPVMLNHLVPELTLRMTAKIFATDIDDWPALLRAMQETGEEFRQNKLASLPPKNTISQR
jgi:hypothetical protein